MARFIISIAAIICLSMFAFERFSGRLFAGLDGPSFLTKTEIQQSFFNKSLYLHNDLMEGLSSSINDFNLSYKPSLYPQRNIKEYAPLFYTWYALQLFLAVLIIGWNYRFSPRIYYLAAWLLTLTLLPYMQNFRVYSLSEAAPCFFEFIFVFALMDVGLQRMGRDSWRQSLLYAGIFLIGLVYGLIFCPSAFVIISPALLVTTLYAFLKSNESNERYRKFFMCVVLFFLSLLFGWVQYAAGLILDSAASFFHTNITGFYHSRIYASILYIGNLPGSELGPYLFCGATLGMLLAIFSSKSFKLLACMILVCQIILAGGGAWVMSLPKPWSGPSLIYFEMVLFPFYGLFAVYFIDAILSFLFDLFKRHDMKIEYKKIFYILSMFIFIVCILMQAPVSKRSNSYSLPPSATVLTTILANEIAIQPNKIFAGRVANILPNKDWLAQCSYFSKLDQATGNDHQSSGLWYQHIPTLHSYHQEIGPGFFSFYRRFLSSTQEAVYRNWTSFSKIDVKILRLLGVKFILTDKAKLENLTMRGKLEIQDNKLDPLYLYQLSDVNTAGISAKNIVTEPSIFAAENRLAGKDFDLNTAILMNGEKRPDLLMPAMRSALSVIKNGFHLTASSKGNTLLILPLEFNYCIKVIPLNGVKPKIVRVDGILLGVLFDQHVDSIFRYQASPFDNPRCKLKNYFEFKRLWQGTM